MDRDHMQLGERKRTRYPETMLFMTRGKTLETDGNREENGKSAECGG
jgi:hypothetical protein